jgi:hypothetical protein
MQALIAYLKARPSHYKLFYIKKAFLNREIKDVLIRFNLSLYELCYRIRHDIPLDVIFKCKQCGKPVGLRGTHGYKQFCCVKCNSIYTSNSEEIKEKKRQTCKKVFGAENPMQNNDIKKKSLENKLEKNNFDLSGIYLKAQDTCFKKYGYRSYSQTPESKARAIERCLRKYGKPSLFQVQEFKDYCKEYFLENFGVENPAQLPEIQLKMYESRKANGTCRKSREEQECFDLLKSYFPDVVDHHKSDKYPFECDAYIPSLDLYIEFNFYWVHGTEPFDPTNPKHLKKVEFWKNKSKETNYKQQKKHQYLTAIHVWTISDPLKVQTAAQNKLNFLAFYTKADFKETLNSLVNEIN